MRFLRAMAQETKKSAEDGIAVEEIVALQAHVAAGQLQAEDLSRLGKLLELLLSLVQMIEHPKLRLRQLQQKLFGEREESPPPPPPAITSEALATEPLQLTGIYLTPRCRRDTTFQTRFCDLSLPQL
jgi:hypothetical protein